jgi:hypothetical protein
LIYLGIDDTDVIGSPGTNRLARVIVQRLGRAGDDAIICRHQLFFDPRVPYTSGNGSASIQLPRAVDIPKSQLLDTVREVMRDWFVEGSDPGLAMAERGSSEMDVFAERAKREVVTQDDARAVAARAGCHLEGLGGTNQGIIGALSAVALAHGGNDGRVVHAHDWPWPDEFGGVQTVAAIRGRGVAEIRAVTGEPFTGEAVDVGKRLRPNWRDRRIVLLVEPAMDGELVPRAARIK